MDHREQDRLLGVHVVAGALPVAVHANGFVVTVTGDLDLYTGPPLRDVLYAVADEAPGRRIVVDLASLTFLDSSGLGVLVGASKRLGATGGQLRLAGCGGPVLDVLVITGLDRAFPMYSDVDEALAAV